MEEHVPIERALGAVLADGRYRVLRRVELRSFRDDACAAAPTVVGAAVDCETTGLDPDGDRVIELAIRRFRYDADGRIVALDASRSWREDPGVPLDPVIVRLTGLTDADLAGRRIDDEAATELLRSCQLVVAHNARFDRAFVEARLPGAAGLRWACTVAEMDWSAERFEGRSLRWLLAQAGWFYDAHRAADDVDALIELLRHELEDGSTVLARVLAASARPGWIVRAVGAHFDQRAALKGRGYSWDPAGRVWWLEVADADLTEERRWLDREVYAPGRLARAVGPALAPVDAATRHRRLH